MRTSLLLVIPFLPMTVGAQGPICDPQGNVAIYSNYDGGALTINVDLNIPDLKIGVVSYEYSRITLVGPHAANVTALWWAGFNADNDHCSLPQPWTTTISGAPAGTDSIIIQPPATWPNANGNGNIICNYSCDISTGQGGCNTADQIAHFFLTQWGGTLLFHYTQYGCWGNGYSIGAGGNCCENPLATGIDAGAAPQNFLDAWMAGEMLLVNGAGPVEVVDALGRVILRDPHRSSGMRTIDLSGSPAGTYLARSTTTGAVRRFTIAR